MLRKCLGWLRRRPKLSISLVFLAFFGGLNLVAYNHAYSMTHFRTDGSRTGRPESLSLFEKAGVLLQGVNVPRPCNHTDPSSQGLEFGTFPVKLKDGVSLEGWYTPSPNAKAKGVVVLLHGYASCKANLLPEAKAFSDMGYDTALLDLRGSGGSDGNVTTLGVKEADDLAEVLGDFYDPDRPLILYGQSMGSAAILRAIAWNGVRPKAVVIECPFDRLLSTVENRFSAMGLPSFPGAHLLVFWGGVQNGFNGFSHNPVEYARSVQCPVLLMHGAKDTRVTTDQAQSIFANLVGEKEFQLFSDAGHESYLGAQPELWKDTVSKFLTEHGR